MKLVIVLLTVIAAIVMAQETVKTVYSTPKVSGAVELLEAFDDSQWASRWQYATNEKYNGKFSVSEPSELNGLPGDKMLVMPEAFRHYGMGYKMPREIDNTGKTLVVQYEVRLTKGLDCGGAYLKLLSASPELDLSNLDNDTPYSIMFGPDKCGHDSKVHFIFRHKNPLTGVIEEKHMNSPPAIKTDKISHLYTLIVREDNTFEILIDNERAVAGSLLEDFTPAVNPPKEIDDPTDSKPSDWVDVAEIPDPEATKPEDWDETAPIEIVDPTATKPDDWQDDAPAFIPDPDAVQPDDWDEEEDGEWEAPAIPNPVCKEHGCGEWKPPMIRNPAFKGKWYAPMIPNPAYKGPWKARQIPNPAYFEDKHPSHFTPIGAVAFELWTITDGVMFNNILITHDEEAARAFGEATFGVRHAAETELLKASSVQAAAGEGQVAQLVASVQQMAQEKPLVLAAAGLGPVVVLILLCACLCRGKKSPKPEEAAAAAHKKDDDVATPADVPSEAAPASEPSPTPARSEEDKPAAVPRTRSRTRRED